MPSCAECDVRWVDDGPCWVCGTPVVAATPLPDVEEEDEIAYLGYGVFG